MAKTSAHTERDFDHVVRAYSLRHLFRLVLFRLVVRLLEASTFEGVATGHGRSFRKFERLKLV